MKRNSDIPQLQQNEADALEVLKSSEVRVGLDKTWLGLIVFLCQEWKAQGTMRDASRDADSGPDYCLSGALTI